MFNRFPWPFYVLQKIEHGVADSSDSQWRAVFADAGGVLTEAHVERPMQGVFNRPMTSRIGEDDCPALGKHAVQVVASFFPDNL